MAFRKCLLAFALVALLSSLASAQISNQALQCTVNASNTPTVRSEGLAELLGDIVLNCYGGTPTAAGVPVPAANITVFLSTNLTSRITSNPFTEVLMLVDEPHSATFPTKPLSACDATNVSIGICTILGNGTGAGTYDGSTGRPNVFQARVTGNNQVTFFGVPIDPPGTSGVRVIRITNLRGNANLLGVSSTLVPTQIVANLSVSPPTLLPLNNPQQTVAYVAKGLTVAVTKGTVSVPNKFIQCNSVNSDIFGDSSKALVSSGQGGQQFNVVFTEGFPAAWKEKNIAIHLANAPVGGVFPMAYPADSAQDVPAAAYWSESGFLSNATQPTAIPSGFGPFIATAGVLPAVRGLDVAGKASQGTRLMVQFNSIPDGVKLFVQTSVNLTVPAATSTTISGIAQLVTTDSNGANTYNATATTSGSSVTPKLAPVSVSGGSGIVVYEILFDDPFNIEELKVPVAVAYSANQGNNLPAPNVQSTVTGSFAPLSNVGTYDTGNTAPIPRFAPSTTPLNSFSVVKCSCNLLFPWVVYAQGYDTGVAISNTSVDPWGTTPQQGNVTLNYYSAGTPPPAQKTNAPVPGGQTLVFTVSGGGNFGIGGISNGFAGYMIAQAEFQYCHGYAYISSFGALPTSPGTSEGYLGIVLDAPFGSSRTGQSGEVQAH